MTDRPDAAPPPDEDPATEYRRRMAELGDRLLGLAVATPGYGAICNPSSGCHPQEDA